MKSVKESPRVVERLYWSGVGRLGEVAVGERAAAPAVDDEKKMPALPPRKEKKKKNVE